MARENLAKRFGRGADYLESEQDVASLLSCLHAEYALKLRGSAGNKTYEET